ncbi:MAG: hypothetical protein ACRDYC_09535 [Acidimicrobiales bacterium]
MTTSDGGEQEGQSAGSGQQEASPGAPVTPSDLVFRARALAQTHPLTGLATRFVNQAVAQQRIDQPIPEIGIWAGSALIDGYCLRRVESEFGRTDAVSTPAAPRTPTREGASSGDIEGVVPAGADLAVLEAATSVIAADLRKGQVSSYEMVHEELTIAALDRLIARSVESRLDHWRDDIDAKAWDELSEYLTWWVVKGYALRVAEERGAGASVSSPPDP